LAVVVCKIGQSATSEGTQADNENGQPIRVLLARFYARQQIGQISSGAQDVESRPVERERDRRGLGRGEQLPEGASREPKKIVEQDSGDCQERGDDDSR
jgi:hypothetical protein